MEIKRKSLDAYLEPECEVIPVQTSGVFAASSPSGGEIEDVTNEPWTF